MKTLSRFYDMAAETSVDAKVPVTLALLKLNVLSTLQTFKFFEFDSESSSESSSFENISFSEVLDLENNWDLYVLSILVGCLGILVWFRRPQGGGGGAG